MHINGKRKVPCTLFSFHFIFQLFINGGLSDLNSVLQGAMIKLIAMIRVYRTGKYEVHAEDLPHANKLPYAQWPMKRAEFEKYT